MDKMYISKYRAHATRILYTVQSEPATFLSELWYKEERKNSTGN